MRVRFAPSPTGHLHVGNARTALFNYLLAKKNGGTFVLRVEDTDLERSTTQSEQLIYEDLKWLGLNWDEGEGKGGNFGPYRQTERFDIYNAQAAKLINSGDAYYCFCSRDELEKNRGTSLAQDKAPLYSGKCRNIPLSEAVLRIKAGEKAAVRFKVKKPQAIVKDCVHGEVSFPTNAFGDFIIVRPDGAPLYNFAVVVDDILMDINLVIRGDDHLSNAPKHVLIFDALGAKAPEFAHIPMILGPDRSKLSKRHGNTSIEQFRNAGYLPEAMINYMALLSWSNAGGEELFNMEELIDKFSLDRVSVSAAVFDFDKLKWMNGIYIRKSNISRITELCLPYLEKAGYKEFDGEKLEKIVASVRDNLNVLSDISKYTAVYFKEDIKLDASAKEVLATPTTEAVLKNFMAGLKNTPEPLNLENYKSLIKGVQKITGTKGKPLYMAVRVALTGCTQGPELDQFIPLMPQNTLLNRIKKTLCGLSE